MSDHLRNATSEHIFMPPNIKLFYAELLTKINLPETVDAYLVLFICCNLHD